MERASVRARCVSCGKGLPFAAWSRGREQCPSCAPLPPEGSPSATYVPGPRVDLRSEPSEFERILDQLPDELVEELARALEAESGPARPSRARGLVVELTEELALGRSPRETTWALWGFAAGFGLNLLVAKVAQVSSGAPMSDFLLPLAVGGLVAGGTAAAIGWGLARLLDA